MRHDANKGKHLTPTRLASALAGCVLMLTSPASGGITLSGYWWLDLDDPSILDPHRIYLPQSRLTVGQNFNGSLLVGPQDTVDLAGLNLGNRAYGYASFSGEMAVVSLHGSGSRLEVGHNAATGYLEVTRGAVLDGRASVEACRLSVYGCYSAIGQSAGSDGSLLVADRGRASLAGHFVVGNVHVDTPDPFQPGFGNPGASTTGRVTVLTGGVLETDSVTLGNASKSYWALGTEQSIAIARVEGSGSTWRVTGSSYDGGGAFFDMAVGERSTATLDLWHGGRLRIEGPAGRDFGARFGVGGNALVTIRATDFVMTGDAQRGFIDIANGGTATVNLIEAGNIQGGRNMQVGLYGGTGTLNVVGKSGHVRPFIQMASGHGVGVGLAGTGQLNISGGGALSAAWLNLGVSGTGKGSVELTGPGSLIELNRVDGHRLSVGEWGEGSLVVSAGATLDATADAAACANRWCGAMIGNGAGSTARFTVTGAGSSASFLGGFNVGGVGLSAHYGFGTPGGTTTAKVEVLDGAVLNTQNVNVGGGFAPDSSGRERSFSELTVRGAGSVWNVFGSALESGEARIGDANSSGAQSVWRIDQGGLLNIQAPVGRGAGLALGSGGASFMTVAGAGSRLAMSGEYAGIGVGTWGTGMGSAVLILRDGARLDMQVAQRGWINIGEGGSTGSMSLLSGARVTGASDVIVGKDLGRGSLEVDGTGSLLLITPGAGSFSSALTLGMGSGSTGTLYVHRAGRVETPSLEMGRHVGAYGVARIADAGSRVLLSASNTHRLYLGSGELSVAAGGVLDARSVTDGCTVYVWCGALVGAHAGSNASFTVTGAGSRASFLSDFQVGRAWVATQATDGYDEGQAGGTVVASVKVLDGGRLETERVIVGGSAYGAGGMGTESSLSTLSVRGAGSVWAVNGRDDGNARFALIDTSAQGRALVTMDISDGGQLQLAAPAGGSNQIVIAGGAGLAQVAVSGTGSAITMSSDLHADLGIGLAGGNGSVSFSGGAQLQGVNALTVGFQAGSVGRLSFDGAGTLGQLTGPVAVVLGVRDGSGTLNIGNGAQLRTTAASQSGQFTIGLGSSTSTGALGQLNINGVGSSLDLHTHGQIDGVAAEYLSNPNMVIGDRANGIVNVTGGGHLMLTGEATASSGNGRYTSLNVGGRVQGGNGQLNVSGAGSRVTVQGHEAVIWVGNGSTGLGQMQVRAGARVESTLLHLGSIGGTGSLKLDAATIELSGQGADSGFGAALVLGKGQGSTGTASLSGGARVSISNTGSGGADLSLGGTALQAKGSGLLSLTQGSLIKLSAAPGLATASIGYSGIGVATLEGGSSLDLGDGALYVGRLAGAVGTLSLAGNSSVTAAYVGVGSTPGIDTGTGTLMVNNSVLTASTIEIGAHGYVGGNGTLVGNVINRGVFSPGNSPGTLVIDGSFTNLAGGQLVLEIEADGLGGFKTDQLVFTNPAAVDLAGLAISFRFLGQTDPNAFQAGGAFKIDEFIQLQGGGELDHAQFAAVSFSASADAYAINSFSFSAEGGASFSATPVPEPGSWALMLAGLLGLSGVYRMKRDRSSLRASSPSLASTSAAPRATV